MIQTYLAKIKAYRHHRLVLWLLAVVIVLIGASLLLWPRQVTFSYAGSTCVSQLTLFPDLYKTNDTHYEWHFEERQTVGSLTLWSGQSCVTPTQAPAAGTQTVSATLFGWGVIGRHFAVEVGAPPVARAVSFAKPAPATRPLVVALSSSDAIYDYQLGANSKQTDCDAHQSGVSCDLSSLGLRQGDTYPVVLSRSFQDAPAVAVIEDELTIVTEVALKKSSIKDGAVVYAKPKKLELAFTKPLTQVEVALVETASKQSIPLTTTVDGATATVALKSELAREQSYRLTVTSAEATDGGVLGKPRQIAFTTSGGPAVTGVNFARSGIALSGRLVITLDQAIDDRQKVTDFVTVKGVPATVTTAGKQVVISYSGAGRCTDLAITIKKGLTSQHGITQEKPWQTTTRTACHTVRTIGYSHQGRAINAYTYGTGSSAVLFTGAIHGNELSSSLLLQDFMQYLEQHARQIPAHRQIVVVPTLNPDGVARGTRNNVKNVNLNRNFDTSDWKSDINDTNGELQRGGGRTPMSEPETKAIAALSSQLRPRLVLSYHAVGSVVIGNGSGDSARLASDYASRVGYRDGTGQSGEIFDYEISGTYDDWLAQRHGVPSMIVELGSYGYRNFEHHRAAMWAMIQ